MRFILLLGLLYLTGSQAIMVCYYGSWAVYRASEGKFDVEQIDPFLCTHIIFGFAGLSTQNTIESLDPWNDLYDDFGKGAFIRFTNLKQRNPNLVTTLAIGGWNEGSLKYSEMAADSSKRATFVASVVPFLQEYGFDGLDMDWEYPGQRGGVAADKVNYVTLLQNLTDVLHPAGLTLTAALPAGKDNIDGGFNIPAISKILDYMHIMAYDLHGSWETYVHHHTILYPYPEDTGDNAYLNVDWALNYWIDEGADRSKIVLGTGTYGRCFTLSSQDDTGIYAPASGAAAGGQYSREAGFMGYNEICEDELDETWNIINDPVMNEPYAYYFPRNNIWCGYETPESLVIKGAYARSFDIAGIMSWSLETDDFHGNCNHGVNPLITSVYSGFNGGSIPTTQSTTTTTRDPNESTTTSSTTTANPTPKCTHVGVNYYEPDCQMYYNCAEDGNGGYIEYPQQCPEQLLMNPNTLNCDTPGTVCAIDGACPYNC